MAEEQNCHQQVWNDLVKVLQFFMCAISHCHFIDSFYNYFTTFNLLEVLLDKNIFTAGTAWLNCFANPPLKSENILAKQRERFDQVYSIEFETLLCCWGFL